MDKPVLLDYSGAAEYLGVSPFTLRRWTMHRRIGFTRLGAKAVRFSIPQLQEFISAGTVAPRGEK